MGIMEIIGSVGAEVISGAILAVGGIIGWLFKGLKKEVEENRKHFEKEVGDMRDRLHSVEVELPTNYINKREFKDFTDRLFSMLDTINAKIDKYINR